MLIKEIKAGELSDFVNSDEYAQLKVLPISRHRALSHVANPKASSDDVVLILIYVDGQLDAYVGILPDEIVLNSVTYKIGWLSCIWVNPDTKGKALSKKLLSEAFRCYEGKILVTQFTPEARGSYLRSGLFAEPVANKGIRCYCRFNLKTILPPKKKFYANNRKILSLIDKGLNLFYDLKYYFTGYSLPEEIEFINLIDKQTQAYIDSKKISISKRCSNDINWIISNPWILSMPCSDAYSKRYHFSSIDRKFEFINIKVFSKNNLIAFLCFSHRNGHLKLPYAYFEAAAIKQVVSIINALIVELRVDMFTCFHQELVKYIAEHNGPYYHKKVITQEYLFSLFFEEELKKSGNIVFQDGDGDAAFT